MRRQELQLLAQARQGDATARCEVGRRYLLGVQGFPKHVATGLGYLQQASAAGSPLPAILIAEGLTLHELVEARQLGVLAQAAAAGSALAQLRQGLWGVLRGGGAGESRRWWTAAAAQGHAGAARALQALGQAEAADGVLAVLQALDGDDGRDAAALARLAARQALADGALQHAAHCLRAALTLDGGIDTELATLLVAAVQGAEAAGTVVYGLPGAALRDSLAQRAGQGDRDAAYLLGRGLSGIDCPALPAEVFAEHQNMRKGAAFLLRAADAGCDGAWMHLYRLHADHRLSVANPQLARFFLEKAALRGQAQAQRKLGALMLREAANLADAEQAIHWLHQAAGQGDDHALALMRSLVLPVAGSDAEAGFAIEQLRRHEPWLAARLGLARAFGLTKLEALCVDPVDGLRPWGLVVGRNPFIAQVRLSAPRAVPAVSAQALDLARQAAALFGRAAGEGVAAEGDLRARSSRQRRLFERLGLDEAMFFADASAMTLESLRLGAKWAYRAREPLSQALAA